MSSRAIGKIFDVGMYDGADTAYYLACGHQVVAVEANPDLVESAKLRFSEHLASGQLTCINAAISPDGQPVELTLSGQHLGSSSIFGELVAGKRPIGAITVPGITLPQLFERYGVPLYLKVDIEGADRLCVLALTSDTRPTFLSFEVGDDADELLSHVQGIGFRRFKIVNQMSFRELTNQRCLSDRIAHRVMRYMGYREPLFVRKGGRFFAAGHSSGPVPWHGDGSWRPCDATRAQLPQARASNTVSAWYDIHATTE